MTFKELHIIKPILRALTEKGYTNPTPIQEQSIPILLKGKDLLGSAQTGTGKTAAFSVPILQHLYLDPNIKKGRRKIRVLVVTPTRELAIQIADSFSDYGKYTGLKNTVIFGGVKQKSQTDALRRGVDILVATPGRLLDLMSQGFISLRDIEYFVLDEADHMLDMGFIHDIRKILVKLPAKRQSLFFSATMPRNIVELSKKILGSYERVSIQPKQTTAERVSQAVYFVNKSNKVKLLIHILQEKPIDSVLVFSRTKHGANKIVKQLDKAGIQSEAIHGNKSQVARQKALSNFKKGTTKVLVATDIAARGIDVSELSLVVNYDLPNISETYVHRVGRTGRAKASGLAISFCSADEKPYLRDIEKLIKQKVPIIHEHPFLEGKDDISPKQPQRGGRKPQQRRKPNSNSNNQKNFNSSHNNKPRKQNWRRRNQ
ncbi:MAG TPA: DEAD/DEAH box helicase [Lutibacter sp.]|nr:DEAD/DEAH box helicase [Lutibacter sp.]